MSNTLIELFPFSFIVSVCSGQSAMPNNFDILRKIASLRSLMGSCHYSR